MKTAEILLKMSTGMNLAVASYEAGDPTLGRRVMQNEECLSVLMNTVTELAGIVAELEAQAARS